MPLLDGKYEIHGERALGAGATAFDATDPDGRAVRVEWLELADADAEAAFERYRRLLKRLTREGRAHVRDAVGRPGAHFVAWYATPDGAPRARDPELDAAIAAAGFDPEAADVRRLDGAPRLVALPFHPDGRAPADPTPAPQPARPRRTVSPALRAWATGGVLTIAAAALLAVSFLAAANDRVVVLPDVVGTAYEAAADALHGLGLAVALEVVATPDAEPGRVVAVDPAPGTPLRPGREVRVGIAMPPGSVAPTSVPRLVGLDRADVAARLADAGLEVGGTVAVHAAAPAGVVLAQDPPAGATVGRGRAVAVVASLGPEPATTFVPDLVGRTLEDARWLAGVAGLAAEQVVVETLPADDAAPGTVLSQSLGAFVPVPLDTAVLRLVVASASEAAAPSGLPALGGLDEAAARALAAGFDVEVRLVSESALPDGVVAQSLPAGATPADGPLVLTVNARPVPVPRPDVTVALRTPEPRAVPYLWFIEPGIPPVVAEVTATTLDGDEVLVARRVVSGGERLEGAWVTAAVGLVRFDLTLNGAPYGGTLRVP